MIFGPAEQSSALRINGHYACAHDALLNGVLKGDWGFPGWVMSDWGALSGLEAANAGCDQQTPPRCSSVSSTH